MMSMILCTIIVIFFNDTATTEIYTLSLHDALPILLRPSGCKVARASRSIASPSAVFPGSHKDAPARISATRSEEHTSELQLRQYLVCRLLLEKKNRNTSDYHLLPTLLLPVLLSSPP